MHPCGCYHLFVPAAGTQARAPRARFEEPVFVAQRAPAGDGRIVLRIAHRTHYIERVYRDSVRSRVVEQTYRFEHADRLRSLPLPGGGRRSLYRNDGLVAGSERPERWLFWPMGVPSAGQMRQWGHHAVAFVGRRHLDDPDLLDRHFEFADTAGRRGQ